jgi:BirA family biotin operon repressor/biotin-[acetyl-CoA-carboxylase] ligase
MSEREPIESPADIYNWTKSWALARGLKLWAEVEAGSTNTVAKDDTSPVTIPVLETGEWVSATSLYLTKNQTQGRGRGDHVWTMPPGSSLLSSWSYALARVPQPILSPLTGLALFKSGQTVWPEIAFNLKAPNDLFVGDKKTAGLLIETIERGPTRHTVIGLGLNVMAAPASVSTATCLASHWRQALTQEKWCEFLTVFETNLRLALRAGQNDLLSDSAREDLRAALNLHPFLKEPILEVDASGQLRSKSRVIYWHEL